MADVSRLRPNENFWDVNGYKSVIKRTEDGQKMCEFLLKMVEERAYIEKNYAEKLSSWYKKWTHAVEKSPEYGTNKDTLRNCVLEGDKLSDIHVKMKDSLLNLVNSKIRNWKDENYRKQLCSCKPASTFKNEFQKAQKPWAEQVKRVNKLKTDYFKYCQESNDALAQEEAARRSDAQEYGKVKQKCEKATAAMDLLKLKYQDAVDELERVKPTYVTEMNNVFAAAQDFEIKRLEFFKDILSKLTENLQLSKSDSAQEIYATVLGSIANSNPRSDTEWWAENHGPGMNLDATPFQDFLPEVLETISRARTRLQENPAVIVPNIETPAECVVQAEIVDKNVPQGQVNTVYSSVGTNRKESVADDTSEFDEVSMTSRNVASNGHRASNATHDYGGVYSTLNDAHIYSNEVQLEDGYAESNGGSKVRAVYDYDGHGGNELSFEKDDIFMQLKEKDDKGWALGRKDGKVGLFPSDYVEAY